MTKAVPDGGAAGAVTDEMAREAHDLPHVLNEAMDTICNAIQWMRNVRDGVSHPQEGITQIEKELDRVQKLYAALPQAEPVAWWVIVDRGASSAFFGSYEQACQFGATLIPNHSYAIQPLYTALSPASEAEIRAEERDWLMKEVFALCDDTSEKYHDIGQRDLEGKEGAFARGRCAEAKSIAMAIGDVCHSRAAKLSSPVHKLTERERCANIAENFDWTATKADSRTGDVSPFDLCSDIAKAIREIKP